MKINNGIHKILFSKGKLYLDGIQIAGEGINPPKDVTFEFHVNNPNEKKVVEENPPTLEINVHDTVAGRDIGPGQK